MVKEMTATEREKLARQQAEHDARNREIDGTRQHLRAINPQLAGLFAGLRGTIALRTHERVKAHLDGAYSAGLKPDVNLIWRIVQDADRAMRRRALAGL
jgi:hypothetical protein